MMDRRGFVAATVGSVVSSGLLRPAADSMSEAGSFKAIAFDGFTIFDPRPIAALAESLFPGKGADLMLTWRARQFEYQWLRALSGQYADFLRTTEDALVYSARAHRMDLSSESRRQLMRAYAELKPWPDALSALRDLKAAGMRLAFLSNMTEGMLTGGIRSGGLEGLFEHVLSTDRIRTYKPDSRAYRMAMDAFRLKRGEILFAPFAGWDAAGAAWFGYPTFWVNRLGAPQEELGIVPQASGKDLSALAAYVTGQR